MMPRKTISALKILFCLQKIELMPQTFLIMVNKSFHIEHFPFKTDRNNRNAIPWTISIDYSCFDKNQCSGVKYVVH